jgi:hypothetical protein
MFSRFISTSSEVDPKFVQECMDFLMKNWELPAFFGDGYDFCVKLLDSVYVQALRVRDCFGAPLDLLKNAVSFKWKFGSAGGLHCSLRNGRGQQCSSSTEEHHNNKD